MATDEKYLRDLSQRAVAEACQANQWTLVDDFTTFVTTVCEQVQLWSLLAQVPPERLVERAVQHIYCQQWYVACLVPDTQRQPRAWAELRSYLARLVVRLNYQLFYDASATDDVVQVILFQVWKDLAQVREPGSFLGWVNQVARRLVIKQPKEPLTLSLEDFEKQWRVTVPEMPTPVPVEQAYAQAAAHIRCCIDPGPAQAVAIGRFLDEREVKDLAGELGLTPGHVRVLAHRARKQLQKCGALLALHKQHSARPVAPFNKAKPRATQPLAQRAPPATIAFEHVCGGLLPAFLSASPTPITDYTLALQQHFTLCKACETEFSLLQGLAQKLAHLRLTPPPTSKLSLASYLQSRLPRFTASLPTPWLTSCQAMLEIFLEHHEDPLSYPKPLPRASVGWRAEAWRLVASFYTATQNVFAQFKNTPDYAKLPTATYRTLCQEAAAQALAQQAFYTPTATEVFIQNYLVLAEIDRSDLTQLFVLLSNSNYTFT